MRNKIQRALNLGITKIEIIKKSEIHWVPSSYCYLNPLTCFTNVNYSLILKRRYKSALNTIVYRGSNKYFMYMEWDPF